LQQNLNQIMQGRQNQLRGLSSGDGYIGNRDAWMRAFGSWADQGSVNNVSGYKVNTGGLAIGVDRQLSPRANAGAVFAFANSGASSNSSVAPSGITINSYQLGAYGDYSIRPGLQANYQVDGGLNNNKSYRNLSAFNGVSGVGPNANANYDSLVGHLGAGLRQLLPVGQRIAFIPSVRADYTTVRSKAYTETGGGDLNLSVNSQNYNLMMLSADLRVDYMLTNKLRASVNMGAGYNTLNNQVQITSAYQGGGTSFVTNGLQVSPWLYNAGLGVSGWLNKITELTVRYDSQFSSTSYNNNMVSAKLKFWY
jgi:outer membrane autotransporter protein